MGQPKHALPMRDGRTMIEHVVDALRSVCDDVVIVGPDDVLPKLPHVHDRRADCGPLAGIEALLLEATPQAASQSAKGRVRKPQHYLICPCDIPLITADLLQRLCNHTDKPVTLFHVEGRERPEPLPMRIAREALSSVRACLDEQQRSVQALLGRLETDEVVVDTREAQRLRNINTVDDYQELSAE